ncbi:hypothetical protein EUX98_g4149 [Antrodiella citrinella]|uniref:Transforming growth factor beta regulator 1 n=1 Tax=Antrodiella citrinella TaxID=2447956 RepID=A0A4S4N2S9_9APHY|nr:hypothetical protein EUX98_g4149 [Antrodiella citrinella]
MGPPPDVVMGPPPVPPQAGVFHPQPPNAPKSNKDSQDVAEKYRRLKRRYFDLEERHKDAILELRRSGERTVAWMNEKSALLERIDELTTNQLDPSRAMPSPALTAYPRYLLNPRNQREFIRNLDQGVMEAENESLDLDPLQMSRHVGPQARRIQEAEEKERQEEETREARRVTKRPRAGTRTKDSLPPPSVPPQQQPPPPQPQPQPQQQPPQSQVIPVQHNIPLNHPPAPPPQQMMMVPMPMPQGTPFHSTGQGPMHSPPGPAPVSNTVQRLRQKPPTPPSPGEMSPPPSASSAAPSAPPPAPPTTAAAPQSRPESPPSAMQQDDEYMRGPSPPPPAPAPVPVPLSAPVPVPGPMPGLVLVPIPTPIHEAPALMQASASSPALASAPPPVSTPGPVTSPGGSAPPMMMSSFPQGAGMVTLAQYRPTPMDPAKAAQSQMQMTLRPSGTGGPGREMQRHTKPKRLKAHTVTTKSYSIPIVPRDTNQSPMLPLNVGIMTVLNLGTICMREHFHTERYIFPIGYEVTRRYLSTVDPNAEVVYNCKIMDGGDGPKFQIIAADVPEAPFTAGTATGAWSIVVRSANSIRNRQHSNSVSGPDFFGLGQNTIKHLIQELPGADMLKDYVWQKFQEGGANESPVAPPVPTPPMANNGNGAPSHYYTEHGELLELDRPRELQIIHVDTEDLQSGSNQAHDGRVRHRSQHALSQGQAQAQVAQMQQQDSLQQQVRGGGRERRDSRASNASYEDYVANGSGSPASTSSHRERERPPSRSPLLHRERDQPQAVYSPTHGHPPPPSRQGSSSQQQQQQQHPAYMPQSGGGDDRDRRYASPPGTQAGVPATFASIMNAYPPGSAAAAERERSREQEYARQGGERVTPEYAYANGR